MQIVWLYQESSELVCTILFDIKSSQNPIVHATGFYYFDDLDSTSNSLKFAYKDALSD